MTTEATCRRELELEIPTEKVESAMAKVARDFARVARVPGFRPGKAPVTLIRRRFAEDIKSEVLQSLVPEVLEQAMNEKKLVPVTRPTVDKVDFSEGQPLKFHATFEVLPEFELGEYKSLAVEIESLDVADKDVDETLQGLQERAATFAPVEGRGAADGEYAQLRVLGTPAAGGDPVQAANVMCHIGAEETLPAFSDNLRGAQPGEQKRFDVHYPEDYPDPKLAGKGYHYTVDVQAVKERKLPAIDDEFAKTVGEAKSLDEFRAKIRKDLEAARDFREQELGRQKLIELLVSRHDFPVPEALVEHQMDVRLERAVRSLAAQGVNPGAVNVDWVSLRRRQRDRAVDDIKAELILDRIASAENIDATDAELDAELERLASGGGESAAALRARLTKQGSLDRMKSKLRSDKTLEWLYQNARITKRAADAGK